MIEPERHMTVEEYLKFEEDSAIRHEYVRGRIFAMSGATEAHGIICGNLHASIHNFLRGSGCRVFQNDMKLRIDAVDSFYYPDVMVTCEPVDAKSVFKRAPVVVMEVLSPSTKQTDRREKLVAYTQLPSLNQYIMVHQDRMLLEVHSREAGGKWTLSLLHKTDTLSVDILPAKPLLMPIASIYEGLDMSSLVEEPEEQYA